MAISWVITAAAIGLLSLTIGPVECRPAADPDCTQNHDHSIHGGLAVPSPNYGPPRPAVSPLQQVPWLSTGPSISYLPPLPLQSAVSAQQQTSSQIAVNTKYTGPLVTKEETEKLHATAIAEREKLIEQQNAINAAGPAKGGPGDEINGNDLNSEGDSSSSSEEDCDKPQVGLGQQIIRPSGSGDVGPNEQYVLIPVWLDEQQQQHHQGVQVQSQVSSAAVSSSGSASVTYTGPKVTKEETEKLHAEAISKQKELIALQEQINAAGPAPAGASSEEYGEKQTVGQSISSSVSLVQASAQQQQTGAYTGPKVTKEETEKLHAEAITKQKELIALQEQINAAGPAKPMSQDETYEVPKQTFGQSISSSSVSVIQGGAQQVTGVYNGPKVTKEETEKLHAEAIAKQKELIALQEQINAAGPAKPGPEDEIYELPKQTVGQSISSSSLSVIQGGAQQVTGVYNGPKVTKEETEKLHAEAITKQKELIALQEQINAAGPAKPGPDDDKYEEPASTPVSSYRPPPVQIQPATFYPRPILQAPIGAVSAGAVTSAVVAGQQKPYTGPRVTAEETAKLHAEAIAAHAQLVAQQEAINAAGPAKPAPGGGGDGSYESGPDCDKTEGGTAGALSSRPVPLPLGNQAVAPGLIQTQISSGGAAGGGSLIIVKGPTVSYGVPNAVCCDGKY